MYFIKDYTKRGRFTVFTQLFNRVFILFFLLPSLFVNSLGASVLPVERKLIAKQEDISFRLKYPKETISADSDGEYYYLASKNSLRIVATDDIISNENLQDESLFSFVPYWEVSLSHELGKSGLKDIAAFKTNGSHIIYVSMPSKSSSFDLKAFAVRSSKSQSESKVEITNDIGLFAIKGGAKDLAGDGEITVIRDPNNGDGLLLSLDQKNALLHAYNLKNPLRPQYSESFQLDIKGQSNLKFNNESHTGTSFQLQNHNKTLNYSIYELRAKARIQRANALINLEKEVRGNSWIKNFLFLGLFNGVISFLEDGLNNSDITIEKYEDDPILKKLANSVLDEEVFEFLEVNRLLSSEEINKYRLEYNLNKADGGKWFFTVAVLVGTLKFLKIKSKAPSINAAVSHYKKSVYQFSKKLINPNTVLGKKVITVGQNVEKIQLALRSKLIKNYYNMEYPAHAILTLRKQLKNAGMITSSEVRNIAKLGYQEQFRFLRSVAEKKLTSGYKVSNEKLLKQINESLEMTEVFVKKVELNKKFRSLKSQVLALLKKHHPDYKGISLKSDDMVAYILATDMPTVMAKADDLQKLLKNIKGYKYKDHLKLGDKIESVIKELGDVNKSIQGFGTEGKVAKVWDRWAAFTQSYSRFFLPEKFLKKDNYVSKFLNEHTRLDAVKVGKGNVEYVKISGEHAKSAFWLGVTDTIGETISQSIARSTLVDPNERSIGSGDNHLELFSLNGKDYGVHFDLIVHDLSNLVGWWLGMPLGLAKSGMSFGAKGKVSLSKRLFDSVKKGFNPVNYAYGQGTLALPVLRLTSWMLELDYLQDHQDNFDEEQYQKFKQRIDSRLTSFSSFAERKMLGTVVNLPYVNPQFFMQAEFDKIARSLFNSSRPGTMVSALVMPLTSGFFPNRAYGEYFGTNNPYMISLLRKFGAEGILDKIDVNGFTDINSWTETEKSSFYNIMLSLEMAKLAKSKPLSRTASIEEQTEWFLTVGKNLFGENFTDMEMEDFNPRIKIADSESNPLKFRYANEAKEIVDQIEAIKKQTTILPFIKQPLTENSVMIVRKIEQESSATSFKDLNEVISIQAKLKDAIEALNVNQGNLTQKQKVAISIAIYDTLHLLNSFLMNNQMVDKSAGLISPIVSKIERFYYRIKNTRVYNNDSWVNFRQKNLNFKEVRANKAKLTSVSKFIKRPVDNFLNSNLLLFGTIPLYLWMDNQIEAHIRIEEHLANLVSELQEVLFSMTKVIVSESIKNNLDSYIDSNELKNYRKILKEKEELFESIVFNSQTESEKFLESRIYRMPKILATSAPIGMAISGGWMLTHFLLYKNSRGFVKKMTDQFAPGLFKYSLILWIGASQVNNLVEKNMYLHTVDFLKLHPAYYSTLLEIELIDQILKGVDEPEYDYYGNALRALESHENLKRFNAFRDRLQELSVIGETEESSEE